MKERDELYKRTRTRKGRRTHRHKKKGINKNMEQKTIEKWKITVERKER